MQQISSVAQFSSTGNETANERLSSDEFGVVAIVTVGTRAESVHVVHGRFCRYWGWDC